VCGALNNTVVVRNLTIDSGSARSVEDMMSIYLMESTGLVTVVDKKYAALWVKGTSLGCVNSTSIVLKNNTAPPTNTSGGMGDMMESHTPAGNNGSTPVNNGSTTVNSGSTPPVNGGG